MDLNPMEEEGAVGNRRTEVSTEGDYRNLPQIKDEEMLPDFQAPEDPFHSTPQQEAVYSQPLSWRRIIHSEGNIPRPRHGHRALIVNDNMFVFGGGNEGIVNDMSVYHIGTNRWASPQIRGDQQRGAAAAGFCRGAMVSKLYAFGGMVEYGQYSNELHELDLTRWEWKKIRTKSKTGNLPIPRLGHSFVSDKDGTMYLFGGLSNGSDDTRLNKPKYLNDFYTIKSISPTTSYQDMFWETPNVTGTGPSPRESHTAVIYETEDRKEMIIYGGMDGNRLDDLWILDLRRMEWREVECKGIPPLARSLHTATLVGDKMYIFGGWVPIHNINQDDTLDHRWKCTDDLSVLNLKTMTWETPRLDYQEQDGQDIQPKARAGHSAAFANSRIYLWSGRDGYRKSWNNQVCCKDFWYLETEKPGNVYKISLVKAGEKSLEVTWNLIRNAEAYIVQVCKATAAKTSGGTKQLFIRTPQGTIQPAGNGKNATPKTIIVSGKNGQQTRTLVFPQTTTPEASTSHAMSDDIPENFMEEAPEDRAKEAQEPQASTAKTEEQTENHEEAQEEDEWFDVGIVKGNIFNVTNYIIPGEQYQPIGAEYTRNFEIENWKLDGQNRRTETLLPGTHYKFRVCGVNLLGQGKWSDAVIFKTAMPGFPGAPSQIKIQKCPEGASVQWEPPLMTNGPISEYSVYLAVRGNANVQTTPGIRTSQGVEFYRCYVGLDNQCIVPQYHIDEAHIETGKQKPAIIFRIAAKNEKGYGPATQVRWLQDHFRSEESPGPSAQPSQQVAYRSIQNQPLRTITARPGGPNAVATVRQQQIRHPSQTAGPMRSSPGVAMVYRPANSNPPTQRFAPYTTQNQPTRPTQTVQPPHRLIARQPQPNQRPPEH